MVEDIVQQKDSYESLKASLEADVESFFKCNPHPEDGVMTLERLDFNYFNQMNKRVIYAVPKGALEEDLGMLDDSEWCNALKEVGKPYSVAILLPPSLYMK